MTTKTGIASSSGLNLRLSNTSTLADEQPAGMASSSTGSETDDTNESSSSGTTDSDATESDSDSGSESDSELGEVSQEYLDSLLEKAKESMRAKAQEKGKGKEKAIAEEDEIRLGDDEDEDTRELPQLDPGNLPRGYFDFKNADEKKPPELRDIDVERLAAASSSAAPAAPPAPPELTKDGRKMTKKEKKEQKKRTAGPQWFNLPAPDAADLPRLYREVEALRLRNALDPKRFYRREPGEGKGIKGLPEYFAIGTIVPTSTPFGTTSNDNLPRTERKRTLVDELVADSEAKRYAKRKFEDLQKVRGARGRGTLAKRFGSRKPKW